jgi:hypothetical protein
MSKRKNQGRNVRKPSTAQIVFLALTVIIILSFVLSLIVQI